MSSLRRVFDPQPSPVPPSTATTPASVCVTCSREDTSRDIAIFGVSSCLDMASLERDMRAGCGTKAHAEATRHASTRNSAPDNKVWQSVSTSGGAERIVSGSRVSRERARRRRARGVGGEAEISGGEAHSYVRRKGDEERWIFWCPPETWTPGKSDGERRDRDEIWPLEENERLFVLVVVSR